MHLEFVGLPGSGKSTLKQHFLRSAKLRGLPFISTEEAFYETILRHGDTLNRLSLKPLPRKYGIRAAQFWQGRSLFQTACTNAFLADHGRAFEAFIRSDVYENMTRDARQSVIGNLLETGSLWSLLQSRPDTKNSQIVFEEGFIQKSLMFIDAGSSTISDQQHIDLYFDNIPLPDTVVYIKASEDLSYQRMCSREDGLTKRLRGSNKESILSFLQLTRTHLDHSVSRLTEAGCSVIEMENQGTISDLTESLCQFLSAKDSQ